MKSEEAWAELRRRRLERVVDQFVPGQRQGHADVIVIGQHEDGTWWTGGTDERGMLDLGPKDFPSEDDAWDDVFEGAHSCSRTSAGTDDADIVVGDIADAGTADTGAELS